MKRRDFLLATSVFALASAAGLPIAKIVREDSEKYGAVYSPLIIEVTKLLLSDKNNEMWATCDFEMNNCSPSAIDKIESSFLNREQVLFFVDVPIGNLYGYGYITDISFQVEDGIQRLCGQIRAASSSITINYD